MGCVGSAAGGGAPLLGDDEFPFVDREHVVDDFWKLHVLHKEMGTGASCRVLSVHNKKEAAENNKKMYACKEMVRDDEWNPRLFQTEHDILTRLKHPNVLKYIDSWVDRKNFYVLNELCTGGELFERIHKHRKFSEKKAASILIDIISAIGFCHKQNVVHRDLKPENIVYRKETGKEDTLVIIDFGDAKIVEDQEMYNEFVGTAFYLPPEIIRDRKGWELKASDMWSIGIIAYVLMTGRPPFHGKSHKDILRNIIKQELKFPKNSKLSDTAKGFVRKLCEKQPRRRYRAEQALRHKFLKGGASNEPFPPEVLTQLQSYHSACLLKRVLVKLGTENLSTRRQDLLVKAFNVLDKNGDGKITRKELISFLKSYGIDENQAYKSADDLLEDIGSKTGSEGSRIIKKSGFKEGAVAFDLSQEKTIKKTFNFMSKEKTHVSKEDLSKYFQHRVDSSNLEQMLKEIDKDKDGLISFEEFKAAMSSPLKSLDVLEELKKNVQKTQTQS